jgi:hypothetical protein
VSPNTRVSRFAPLGVGAATAALIGWVAGFPHPIPFFHDEAAYILQAKVFAAGRWNFPAPSMPEFFEQFHVVVFPFLASKYPPGNSLLLTPGVWLGFLPLVPLLLTALTGSLIYVLARSFAGGQIALLTWLLWMQAPATQRFGGSYLSEVPSTALWLAAWWGLSRWKAGGRTSSLCLAVACVAWEAITRPLTAIALAIPIAFAILRFAVEKRTIRSFFIAGSLGAAIIALLPLWDAGTTGNWRVSPLAVYTRTYFPFDVLGFGDTSASPTRSYPQALDSVSEMYRRIHREHTVARLPRTLSERLDSLSKDLWGGLRPYLAVAFLAGLFFLPSAALFALATSFLLIAGYIFYAHLFSWTVYYVEAFPAFCFVTAVGLFAMLGFVSPRRPREPEMRGRLPSRVLSVAVLGFLAATLVLHVLEGRMHRQADSSATRAFLKKIESIPVSHAVVFVRYAPKTNVHRVFVANEPDLASARVWIVHDLGPKNARLLRSAPYRVPYLYDESVGTLVRLPPR